MANKDNPGSGARFETAVSAFLASREIHLRRPFALEISAGSKKGFHKFDLGSDDPKVVVECKRHTWTATGNSPSAKMAMWNEAMYYFHLVPADYRKMFFVLLHRFEKGKTLVNRYIGSYEHLIPPGVEIWEFDEVSRQGECVYPEMVKL